MDDDRSTGAPVDDAARAVAAERVRIARELHDVVAHEMTGVVLQAQGARSLLDTDPARVREALERIESSSRTALDELRRMLGVLRHDEVVGGPAVDQARGEVSKSLRDIQDLIADFVDTFWTDDDRDDDEHLSPLEALDAARRKVADRTRPSLLSTFGTDTGSAPPGVQTSAFRIVQEALTNIGRHAGRCSVEISIACAGGDTLVVEVRNGPTIGTPATDPATDGAGLGLTGIRERAEALGGAFEAGPTDEGGWRVLATLPFEAPGPGER